MNSHEAHSVTVYNFERFTSKLAGLNKKAAKWGLERIEVGSVEEQTKYVRNRFGENVQVFSHYEVELVLPFSALVLAGSHRLVGVVDHVEGLVRSVPGSTVSLTPYVERGAVCDHCGQVRQRNETFVVESEGRLLQVGRQCLGAYLGIAPERALGQVDVVKELLEDEEWRGERGIRGIDLGFYLSHVACLVRTAGWRSRSAAQEAGESATADLAWANIANEESRRRNRYGEPLWYDRTPADKELAQRVAVWLEGLNQRQGLNDYLSNLAQVGRNGFVTDKSLGFAASAVAAYQREQEQAARQAAERAGRVESSYVGKVGERITFNRARLVKSFGFDSEWGYQFIHKFLTDQGEVLVWKTGVELDQDEVYKLTASIKGHEEYKGERQTVLTRAKALKLEQAAA